MAYKIIQGLVVMTLCLPVLAQADSYRWRDNDGKLHFGASVPAEYADRPYDIINSAGLVIQHVEPGNDLPKEVVKENKTKTKTKERAPLISPEERRRQADRYLLLQYKSEDDILHAQALELAQMDYDLKIVKQSFDSTQMAIESQIRDLADQQRGGKEVNSEQERELDKLYARQEGDRNNQARLVQRESDIRARFKADVERFRFLTSKDDTQPVQE